MKGILSMLVALLGLSARVQGDMFFVAGSQGIYRGALDTTTMRLGPVKLVCAAKHPNFLALSKDGRFLYAALDQTVAAFAVGPDGAVTQINEAPSGGAEPCHLSLDPSGHHLLVANYSGGNVTCLRIRPDGSVGEKVGEATFTGSGPNPNRQKKPFGHFARVTPDGAWLYACDLGSDSVWIYPFDAGSGEIDTKTAPQPGKVPPGSGPRHFVFDHEATRLYVVNELSRDVTFFTRDAANGSLHPVETVATLPPNTPLEGVTSAGIAMHSSGRWLYVSNRGCNMLSVLAIDPKDGRLTLKETLPAIAVMPRHFALDPTGRFLIAEGQKDGRLVLFTIDPETGLLTATNQTTNVPGAMCLVFAR